MIVASSFDIHNPELWLNRALQYGDGVFETMRVHKGRIPLLKWHMKRLQHSLSSLNLDRFDQHLITAALADLEDSIKQSAIMKLVVFRGAQKRGYQPLVKHIDWVITADAHDFNDESDVMRLAVATMKLSQQKALAGIKHLSRLEQVMIADELNQHSDCEDLLLLDNKNRVVETTYQNLVGLKEQQLYTPWLNQCGVQGVGLQWLSSEFDIKSTSIHLNQLKDFEVLLVGNSIRGFRPVKSIKMPQSNRVISFATSSSLQDKINHLWSDLLS